MLTQLLRVISTPAPDVVVFGLSEHHYPSGRGDIDLACGGCGYILMRNASETIEPCVFRCRRCGRYNEHSGKPLEPHLL